MVNMEVPQSNTAPDPIPIVAEFRELFILTSGQAEVGLVAKKSLNLQVIVHVHEVIDRFPILNYGNGVTSNGTDSRSMHVARKHEFSCTVGRVDGSVHPASGDVC